METMSMNSFTSSKYGRDSDTSSVYSFTSSITSSHMSTLKTGPGLIHDQRLNKEFDHYQKHMEKKYKREVEKQRRRLFGEGGDKSQSDA